MEKRLAAELAAAAHHLWCQRMIASGWRAGAEYDESRQIHDALVSFERLREYDRRLAVRAVLNSGIEESLAKLINHQRGPSREFGLEEMRPGLRVAMVPGQDEAARDDPETGLIESWETDDEGELRLIRVRWPDGELSEHLPVARELRRV